MTPPPHLSNSSPRGSFAGRMLRACYHTPIGRLRLITEEGLVPYFSQRWGQVAMKAAARKLPTDNRAPDKGLTAPIVFLTGAKYWHETLFCARSLLRVLPTCPRIRIISDGSLNDQHIKVFRRILPHAEIVTSREIESRLEAALPRDRYPLIRFYREYKPILRKLTDIFSITAESQLLLDSDMLFFAHPTELMAWVEQPAGFLAMLDTKDAYGYSHVLMQSLSGSPIPSKLNIGVFGLAGSAIDWDEIENWIRILTETEGLKYNLCQALSAMLYSKQAHQILSPEQYLILPMRSDTLTPSVAMHHYVAESKQWYRRYAWRHHHNFCDAIE